MRFQIGKHTRLTLMAGVLGAGALSQVGCGAPADELGTALPAETLGSTAAPSYEEFKAGVTREVGTGAFLVDGDVVLHSEEQLRTFYERNVQSGDLIVHAAASYGDSRWTYGQRLNLTYCVSTAFGGNYGRIVQATAEAAAAWQAVANVRFIHLSGQDGACDASNPNVVFDVNPTSGQSYAARAFYPDYARVWRNILVDSSAFGSISPFTLAGIMRHELGHALGFDHEHIRPESGACFENNAWRPLTGYDAASVMHYPHCNGANSGDYVLTATDAFGVKALYGGNFLLQTGTVLPQMGTNATFALAPGSNDLFIILQSGTGTHTTEVHVLSAASNYQQFTVHLPTALHETDGNWAFAVAANRDLFAINKAGGSGTTEVHVLSAASNYQQFTAHLPTALHPTNSAAWDFEVAADNRDVFAINKSGGNSRADVHVLSAASNYQQFSAHISTALHSTNSAAYEFTLAENRDVAVVSKISDSVSSGATEMFVLSAASGYQSLSKGSTAFPQADSTWNFFLNSARDLVGVKRTQTGSGTTEVHIADMQ